MRFFACEEDLSTNRLTPLPDAVPRRGGILGLGAIAGVNVGHCRAGW